jgi:hypothetical protein
MLHRLKLRILYGSQFDSDPVARRKKLRVILISGFLVYPPFLLIAYLISFEARAAYLVMIGLFSAITCIPVVFYAYAKGFNEPFLLLWKERRMELVWLAIKIGFIYAFVLYWMILGIVEFLFGYSVVRAAMISFVAAAVARDGFEIGFLRSGCENRTISVFPDGQPFGTFFIAAFFKNLLVTLLSFSIAGGIGFLLGSTLENTIYQTVASGLVGGGVATLVGVSLTSGTLSRLRFFIWPGFIMAATYFLILAYLLRILFQIRLSLPVDLAILMALSTAWLSLEIRFLGYLNNG